MNDEPNRLFPKITDEALDALRRRLNARIENTLEPWCHEATRDAIRHYAHGIGDDNPLWCDPEYAANTRWGGIVALPSFLFATSRIISAGWTMSAVEIEDALLRHPAVREAAAIGVPDAQRGHVVKAFVVTDRPHDDALLRDIQGFVRARLGQHEYPRIVAFVAELPKTPAGKVNRKMLRTREGLHVD